MIAIAKEYGFDVSEDDLAAGNADGSKLDMEEPETVSGGNDLNEDEAWKDVHS